MCKKLARFYLFFWGFLFLVSPINSFAQVGASNSNTNSLSLTPPDTDLSVGYLSNIFGTVDGVLAGTGSQLLGAMFGVFNGAILVLGGIVILYTLFISTLNTAHEGEMLGKRWSSIWIPLRSVLGIALLVPKASGYSFVQIFMMWVAVMGVGAADSVWNRALDYFLLGGVLITQNQDLSSNANVQGRNNLDTIATSVLRSLTCIAMLQQQLTSYRNGFQDGDAAKPPPVPNFYQEITSALGKLDPTVSNTIDFPTLDPNNSIDKPYLDLEQVNGIKNPVCGSVSWDPVGLTGSGNVNLASNNSSRTTAMAAMINNYYGTAQSIVTNFLLPTTNTNRVSLGYIISSPVGGANVWGAGTLASPQPYLLSGKTVSDAVNSYFGLMSPALNLLNQPNITQAAQGWVNKAKQNGWILAGSFYFAVISLNQNAVITENNPPKKTDLLDPATSKQLTGHFGAQGATSQYVQEMEQLLTGADNYSVGTDSHFITDVVTYGNSLTNGNVSISTSGSGGSANSGYSNIDSVISPIFGVGGQILQGLQDLANSQGGNNNPVVGIATLGNGLVTTVFNTYIAVAVIVLVLGLGLGALFGFAFAAGFAGLVQVIMGMLSPILIPLMVTGLTMLFYIPMIPFIIFTFGAIGWFIAVVEAIMAAPLVALGIAHPEGQEILGKAEPAVGLLVNVFLRPTFMIFGLLIGMMLSYVGIWILNQGVYGMFYGWTGSGTSYSGQSVVTNATNVAKTLFAPCAFLVIYVLIAMQIVQKSFTLIYVIPDEVLKWIGINIKGMGGEAEAESKIAGGYQGAAQAQADTTSKTGDVSKGAMDTGAAHEKAVSEGVTGLLTKEGGLLASGKKDDKSPSAQPSGSSGGGKTPKMSGSSDRGPTGGGKSITQGHSTK